MFDLTAIRPKEGQTTADVLRTLVGKHVILNVTTNREPTSVCVNIERSGSAAWRRKEKDKKFKLTLEQPGFSLTDNSLILSYELVNVLASNFQSIREALPLHESEDVRDVAIGTLARDGAEMGKVLGALEMRTADILNIVEALSRSLDTPLSAIRYESGRSVRLMAGPDLSEQGNSILRAFSQSQAIYSTLPALRGFGTGNIRGIGPPGMKGASLRWYMQNNKTNPLGTTPAVNYVDYELKPLNISDTLKWTCSADPRTESVDLLLTIEDTPALTEVKMDGDDFTSKAVVQLLYYAAILANHSQAIRLSREFRLPAFEKPWLCVIAEERQTTNKVNFESDLAQTLDFLRHAESKAYLSPFFAGVAVLIIQKATDPFGSTRGISAFKLVENGQQFIRWS
jgi:hypothetical protein